MPVPNTDYIYWTFSAASQSIAAFVALLMAGYALVHTMMESAREQDDSLEEIHSNLKQTYHCRLRVLAWLTGAAIVLSLIVVYLNRPGIPPPTIALFMVALIDLAAVIFGVAFVVSIVDPAKYRNAAKKALEKDEYSQAQPPRSSATAFFDAFIHLERQIRDYLRSRDLYIPSRGAPKMSYSFRQMIEALRQNEIIDQDFFNELIELSRYRNLVFHGHVSEADSGMAKSARNASLKFESLPKI